MNTHVIRLSSLFVLSALTLAGCGSGSDTIETIEPVTPANSPPTFTSGESVTVNELSDITLSVTATDNDGDELSYLWVQMTGTPVGLDSDSTSSISFTAPAVAMADESEAITFNVSVSDGVNQSVEQSIDVVVNAIAIEPTFELAHEQIETYGNQSLTVDCSVADADGEISEISISQSSGDDIAVPSATGCPFVIPLSKQASRSQYAFDLSVTDDDGLTVQRQLDLAVRPLPKLSDTGVTTCVDNAPSDSEAASFGLDCTLSVDDEGDLIPDGQDGKTGMSSKYFLLSNDGFQYTKLDAEGNALADDAEQFSCVYDNVTHLLWEVKTDDDSLHSTNNSYSWYLTDDMLNGGVPGIRDGGTCNHTLCDTLEFTRLVNESGLCGVRDWRLPNAQELITLVHYGKTDPAINLDYFPHTQSIGYWTATPNVSFIDADNFVQAVYFSYGTLSTGRNDRAFAARLVANYEIAGE